MTLKKITPKALKNLKELGLLDVDLTSSYEIFLNEEKLKKVWETMFVEPMPEYETLDLGEFTENYTSFFGQLLPNFKKLMS